MYGKFVLFDDAGQLETGERVYLGELKGKNEAWLRDMLFRTPEIIPVVDIDSTFGPLVPVCKELRTDAGQIDALFMNERGRLTIVECKLWKNPQARREVVAQTLDYVSALCSWSYADLQKYVVNNVGGKGNIPFELVRKHTDSTLREQQFVDAVSRSLREGRILVLLAGDGIREGVQSLTELVNRSATRAFTFGLVEVALYQFGKNRFAIQPRVLAKTEMITRQMTFVSMKGDGGSYIIENGTEEGEEIGSEVQSGNKDHLKAWWKPVLEMTIDDPEQEPPFWVATNNAILNTPFPGIQIKAFAIVGGSRIGVFLSGPRRANVMMLQKFLKRERTALLSELPDGTEIALSDCGISVGTDDFEADDGKRAWIIKTMNAFSNALRPRLRRWYEETRGAGR